jgi:hypothetical protein
MDQSKPTDSPDENGPYFHEGFVTAHSRYLGESVDDARMLAHRQGEILRIVAVDGKRVQGRGAVAVSGMQVEAVVERGVVVDARSRPAETG